MGWRKSKKSDDDQQLNETQQKGVAQIYNALSPDERQKYLDSLTSKEREELNKALRKNL